MHSVLYYFQSLSLSSPTITLSSPLHSAMTIVRKTFCGIVNFAEFPAFLLHKSQAKLECPALMTRICTNPELTSFTQMLQPSCFRFHRPWVFPPSFLHQYSCSPQTSPKLPKKRRRPELPWSRSASAGSANLCYSDDTLSPAIVLLLWCYSPLSLVFECYSSCAIATTPFCLVPDCFDLFHKVEILHLAQQGIAASLSECPWLTPTPVIKNHTWSVIVDDHSSLYVWCSNVGRGHGAADFNVNVSNADFKLNFANPAGRGRLIISCIFGPHLVGWSAVVIFSEESKAVDQQLVRYEVDQLRSC